VDAPGRGHALSGLENKGYVALNQSRLRLPRESDPANVS
jgi:hypothetical protein